MICFIYSLIRYLDKNRDGLIDYTEFFSSFELVDDQLAKRQRTSNAVRKTRQPVRYNHTNKMQTSTTNNGSNTKSSPTRTLRSNLVRT